MKMRADPAGPRLCVAEDYGAMSRQAARFVVAEAGTRPNLLVCASGGGSWAGCYEQLARRHRQDPNLFRRLRVVQIDEWCGLRPDDPATCRTQILTQLVGPLDVTRKRFAAFQSNAPHPSRECARMRRWLAGNGPIDLCLLGIGLNGHIALNEPAATQPPGVRVAKLAARSRQSGMLKNAERKPRYGLTLGVGDILRSRKILLLVSGEAKRAVLQRLLQPLVTRGFPRLFSGCTRQSPSFATGPRSCSRSGLVDRPPEPLPCK